MWAFRSLWVKSLIKNNKKECVFNLKITDCVLYSPTDVLEDKKQEHIYKWSLKHALHVAHLLHFILNGTRKRHVLMLTTLVSEGTSCAVQCQPTNPKICFFVVNIRWPFTQPHLQQKMMLFKFQKNSFNTTFVRYFTKHKEHNSTVNKHSAKENKKKKEEGWQKIQI